MKHIILLLFIILLHATAANSQTLRFVRTDVDSSRSSIITATYLFGVDIYADSIENCRGISFEVTYNMPTKVRYSSSSVYEFAKNGSFVVIPQINNTSDMGNLFIGVLAGRDIKSFGAVDPKIIHLEFAVSQSAAHQSEFRMQFSNVQAVVYSDSGGSIVNISVPDQVFQIHSYIDVWPGDADNDGIVDTRDISAVGLYLGYGSSSGEMRSFKRLSPSTIWTPQHVLAWDSLAVTYADCDGNGDVTITDLLIIPLNFSKQHTVPLKDQDIPQVVDNPDQNCSNGNTVRIPVYVSSSETILGASGLINLGELSNYADILCLEKGDIFDSESFLFMKYNEEENNIEFATGSTNQENKKSTGTLVYIIAEPKQNIDLNNIGFYSELYGINQSGIIFPLNSVSSVDEKDLSSSNLINESNNVITLSQNLLNFSDCVIRIFNSTGNLIETIDPKSGITYMDLNYLPQGVYFVSLTGRNISELHPVFVIK